MSVSPSASFPLSPSGFASAFATCLYAGPWVEELRRRSGLIAGSWPIRGFKALLRVPPAPGSDTGPTGSGPTRRL